MRALAHVSDHQRVSHDPRGASPDERASLRTPFRLASGFGPAGPNPVLGFVEPGGG
jgi:hypothetical protein